MSIVQIWQCMGKIWVSFQSDTTLVSYSIADPFILEQSK
jgi:hypothetical protein